MAKLEGECRKIKAKPCYHLTAKKLTEGQFEQLVKSDWLEELEELIRDVEGRKPTE